MSDPIKELFADVTTRTLLLPCCLRDCPRFAKVVIPDSGLPSNYFVLCPDCEDAVIININAEIEASGAFPEGWTREMVQTLALWRHRRDGLTLPHKQLTSHSYSNKLT